MNSLNKSLASFAPYGPTIIRVVIGALFVLHGIDKFNGGLSGVEGFFAENGVPAAGLTAPLSAFLEVILGTALIAGFFTRVSALIMTGFIAAAIIFIKADGGILGSAELELAYIAGLLGVALLGPGKLSVDEAIKADTSTNLVAA